MPLPSNRPPRWRTLLTVPLSGAENMALDCALLHRARRSGEVVLRVYGWLHPTLSLGRNQRAAGLYHRARAHELGVAFVRRPTGGRAVLHHREITYSITAPEHALGEAAESYSRINRLLLTALGALGVDAEPASAGPAPRPGTAPCFACPVAGEIVVGERKLVGSAQLREHGALLQHGSILVDDDQDLASLVLAEPAPSPPEAATLRGCLGRAPEGSEMLAALCQALSESGEGEAEPLCVEPSLLARAALARSRFTEDAWTWRR